jgi:anti-sigma factor (TIGR02949 family)
MMDCKEVGSVLFLFFDGEMEDDMMTPFRDHVGRCGHCGKQVDYTRKLLLIVRERTIRCTAPDSLRLRILTHLPHRRPLTDPH